MALSGVYSNLNILFRWLHVLAGITWLGLLYFFNFVMAPAAGSSVDSEGSALGPALMARAQWWYRWSAMITLLAGLALFIMNYAYIPGVGFAPTPLLADSNGITARAAWILFGMILAAIMWFNVWFAGWPAQKKQMEGKASGAELALLRRRSYLTLRANAYLSGPMLFGMVAPAHYGAMNLETWLIAIAVGLVAVWCAFRVAPRVGRLR